MMNKTIGARRITVPAMLVAISLILMLLSSSLDTGKLGTMVLLSLLPMILLQEGNWMSAAAAYGATLVCSLILLPDKMLPLAYGLFLGIFAFAWQGLQRLNKPWLRLLLALLGFNIVWLISLILVRSFWAEIPLHWIYPAGQPVFILYYYFYGYAVHYYQRCWAHRIHQWMGGQK